MMKRGRVVIDSWPTCTVPGCGHGLSHKTHAEVRDTVANNKAAWVNRQGWAVCRCHDPAVALEANVTAFPCDASRANLSGPRNSIQP